ncbi:protein FRIGIDA [Trifolium pratense]|uniref:FRIGIDA-like protein n=2 Tax=Trifolium pratense TaxID=57577 RepID=A0A2K3LT59_TRIPR|nr:protein FRIGIDA [Trifolium pratense]
MPDIIDELVKNGKEIEAVYFASESGLTERFQPIELLESYVKNYKNNVATILMNGNNSQAATDESNTLELNSIKDIIKCVEDHKLESEFKLDKLKRRASQLEKSKAERKKPSSSSFGSRTFVTGSRSRKRGSRGSGSTSSRPAKSAKTSAYPSSFSRRNLAPLHPSPSPRYSAPLHYPSQTMMESSTAANPYAATYGTSITQSPAGIGITQQHYSYPVDNLGPSSYLSNNSYAGQTSYGLYDYGSAAPPTYPYTVDQTNYRG